MIITLESHGTYRSIIESYACIDDIIEMILISSSFFLLSVLWHRICNAFWLPFSLQQKLDWRTLIFFFCMVRKKKSVLHIVLDDSGNANLRNYHAKWQSQLQKDLGHVWFSLHIVEITKIYCHWFLAKLSWKQLCFW